jgi:hypothetical protein
MTIGVGAHVPEGIVLCSDMELTGNAKYKAVKDFQTSFADNGILAAIYSGSEDDMLCLWEEIERGIKKEKDAGLNINVNGARSILKQALAVVTFDKKNPFSMLLAIAKENEHSQYLRVVGNRDMPAPPWDVIGVGDCELSRFLITIMDIPNITKYQAFLWSSYIVGLAKSYVRGVGQGVRISFITPQAKIHYMSGDTFSDKMLGASAVIGGLWTDFCNLSISQEEFKKRSDAVYGSLLAIRGRIPRILGS